MSSVTNEEKRAARVANLYSFLCTYHERDIIHEGNAIRLKKHRTIYIKRDHSGYTDYSVADGHGNGIDLLCSYLQYTFIGAVEALCCFEGIPSDRKATLVSGTPKPKAGLPPRTQSSFRRAYAYLTKTRGLGTQTVSALIQADLIYQDDPYGNVVFVNHERDYCELRGTASTGKSFHACRRLSENGYWSFRIGRSAPVETAYICEAAIDAISLYEIQKARGDIHGSVLYCSIGGVSNQKVIDHIAQNPYKTILAVDNDLAGDACRKKNPHLPCILPRNKDWNEDWLKVKLNG